MTRHIRPRPERAAELHRLAEIASKCYALHDATRSANAAPLTGTEYLVIAKLLERVSLDGENVAADYWETIKHRPTNTATRDLYIAIDAALRRTKGERKVWQSVAAEWGKRGVNAADDTKKLAQPYKIDAATALESARERGAAGLEKLARDVAKMRRTLGQATPRRKGGG
jgi:hypothetical protein